MVHDCAFDDEYLSSIGVEAAYCRAAADSHTVSCADDESGGAEVGSAPFGGQGSVMYTYRESSKMRFGTFNVKGSLQGATGVRQELNDSLLFILATLTFCCVPLCFFFF